MIIKTAIITVGISASGKTTWARQFQAEQKAQGHHWSVVCRDDIRYHILDEKSLISDYSVDGVEWSKWNWKWEKEVTERYWSHVERYAAKEWDIILADTNLRKDRRDQMIERLRKLGYDSIIVKRFEISLEEAWARDAARPNGVGHSVISKQWAEMVADLKDAQLHDHYIPNNHKPAAVMVDIDGTLAHMSNRGPFEWNKVGLDTIDVAVREVISGLKQRGYTIIYVSGRDGACRDQTLQWLMDNDTPSGQLLMRSAGDMRKDTIVKKELFDAHIRDCYNVHMVIDDRPSVCRMWSDLGLKVMQVGNPYIEF